MSATAYPIQKHFSAKSELPVVQQVPDDSVDRHVRMSKKARPVTLEDVSKEDRSIAIFVREHPDSDALDVADAFDIELDEAAEICNRLIRYGILKVAMR